MVDKEDDAKRYETAEAACVRGLIEAHPELQPENFGLPSDLFHDHLYCAVVAMSNCCALVMDSTDPPLREIWLSADGAVSFPDGVEAAYAGTMHNGIRRFLYRSDFAVKYAPQIARWVVHALLLRPRFFKNCFAEPLTGGFAVRLRRTRSSGSSPA
ncbi:MAG: hypothetical protein WC866_03895 [Patescibacteria group bacterium]